VPRTRRKIIIFLIAVVLIALTVFFALRGKDIPYRDEIEKFSYKYGVDIYLVTAIIKAESDFDRYALSSAGAVGLMQVMPNTAEWLCENMELAYDYDRLFEAEFNINLGTFYMSYLLKSFELDFALAAYNAGEGKVREWQSRGIGIEDIPYAETREYVKRVKFFEKELKNAIYLY